MKVEQGLGALKELKPEVAINDGWTFLCQDQNVFDSKKKVKLTNAEGVEFKLSKKQLQAIEFNKALLAMYTNQVGWTDFWFPWLNL